MVLSKKVRIGSGGIHGHCWFAAEDIDVGEMVWEYGDQVYADIDIHKDELAKWPADKREKFLSLAYMIAPDIYRGSDPNLIGSIPQAELDEYFVNHSCDGNCWYIGDNLLVAKRRIRKDEELTYDYALTDTDSERRFNCLCGTGACRGKVSGDDWKRKDLQEKYGNHFTTHVLHLIEKEKQKQKLTQILIYGGVALATLSAAISAYYFLSKTKNTKNNAKKA